MELLIILIILAKLTRFLR